MSAPTKFEYLLNAMENAAACDKPAEHGYGGARQAVLAYVADLESRASSVSPSDAVRRERNACEFGYATVHGQSITLGNLPIGDIERAQLRRAIATRYPLPQVKRPRVRVDGNNVQWRVVGGEVEYKLEGSTLGFVRLAGQQMSITLERVGIISDLLDEPTELVEVDSPSPTGDA